MQDEQQYEQLLMLLNQLKNGAEIISKMIEDNDFDNALSLINSRKPLFNNCKSMLSYLELTSEQNAEVEGIKKELSTLESNNINRIQELMSETQNELLRVQKKQKFQNAYDVEIPENGSIVDFNE